MQNLFVNFKSIPDLPSGFPDLMDTEWQVSEHELRALAAAATQELSSSREEAEWPPHRFPKAVPVNTK